VAGVEGCCVGIIGFVVTGWCGEWVCGICSGGWKGGVVV